MEHLFTSESIISFFILVILEIVLGIDNVIFVSIIMNRLPKKDQPRARRFWMIAGIIVRSLLLLALGWLLSQKGKAIFSIGSKGFDLASIVMLGGGLFLIYKSVREIHHKLEGEDPNAVSLGLKPLSLGRAMVQILIIDAVFSFDSILTAGGTAEHVEIMIAAVVIAMIVMFLFSPKISSFIHKHPTLKMLALSFLLMVGFSLFFEGLEPIHKSHIEKGYIYFAMTFSFGVELLNMWMRKRAKAQKPVELHEPIVKKEEQNSI